MVPEWNDELVPSDEELYDSDKTDSDIEAELYSLVHYEANNLTSSSENSNNFSEFKNSNCAEISFLSINKKQEKIGIDSFLKEVTVKNHIASDLDAIHLNSNKTKISKFLQNKYESNLNKPVFDFIDDLSSVGLYKSFEFPSIDNSMPSNNSNKRKSDKIENLDNIQTRAKKLKITDSENNFIKTSIQDSDIIQLSSDNESDVFCIGSNNSKNHLQTNLSQNSIFLNSDSECSDSSSNNWCYKFQHNSSAYASYSKISKDPWFINDEDKYRSIRNSGRYHEFKQMNCSNCYQKGHQAKFCPNFKTPKCFICGSRHKPSKCKNRMCGKCYRKGHDARYCQGRNLFCIFCKLPGHRATECPDNWRRFSLTTSERFIKPKKYHQNSRIYCYNCGQPGHFGAMCLEHRMFRNSFPTWPCIINFKEDKKNNKCKTLKEKKIKKNFTNNTEQTSQQYPASSEKNTSSLKEQAMLEKKMIRKERRIERKKRRKQQRALHIAEKSENKNSNNSVNFPRTPKISPNLFQSESLQNQPSTAETDHKGHRQERNRRRKMRLKAMKNKLKNRKPLIVKL